MQSVDQLNNGIPLKEPKNGRTRAVALSATVVEELRRHRLEQAEGLLRLGVRLSDDTFVCALVAISGTLAKAGAVTGARPIPRSFRFPRASSETDCASVCREARQYFPTRPDLSGC